MPTHDGLAHRKGTAPDAGPMVIDELVAFWELQPRIAFRDAVRRHLRRALDSACARRGITCLSDWAAGTAIDEIARHPLRDLLRVRPPDGPADTAGVVVALGSLAGTACDARSMVLQDVRRRCAPDAVVVWSHSLFWPGRAWQVRSAFEELFATVEVDVVGAGAESSHSWFVGSAWTSGTAARVPR